MFRSRFVQTEPFTGVAPEPEVRTRTSTRRGENLVPQFSDVGAGLVEITCAASMSSRKETARARARWVSRADAICARWVAAWSRCISSLESITLSWVSRLLSAPDAESARSNMLRRSALKRQQAAAVSHERSIWAASSDMRVSRMGGGKRRMSYSFALETRC
jgi:hypothetical protein